MSSNLGNISLQGSLKFSRVVLKVIEEIAKDLSDGTYIIDKSIKRAKECDEGVYVSRGRPIKHLAILNKMLLIKNGNVINIVMLKVIETNMYTVINDLQAVIEIGEVIDDCDHGSYTRNT
ncbi:MAG: hypothetical protein DRO15_05350 [Thermoprotei archaeon]|nr:MAG: hypothetical protein DRO15_05350 [Thermoprotei archaeon]